MNQKDQSRPNQFYICIKRQLTAFNFPISIELDPFDSQLTKIKGAVEQAFDATFQCGKIRMDCEVRAARQWMINGVPYRDIVIYIQSVGSTSRAVSKQGGSWPTVKIK
ncbi:MAG: hypothetical protein P8173_17150 [Gammaproteobacteria bacterium]